VQNPVHTYESDGVYSVRLTVTNEVGSDTRTRTEYIRVSKGVAAQFSATPESGPVPLTVQFTDQSTGSPISFLWNFGDGQYSDARNPTHTYTRDGVFTVTLSVAGQTGSSTSSREITVYQLPLARFNYKPDNGTDPLTVQFTDRSVGDIITWFWNFGDGQASTVKNPVHTYNEAGEFDVSLTVTDNTGNRSTSMPVKVAVISFTP
jgi:PKD repeat protein